MTFLNTTMLIVAGALAVPILLHLIYRQEFPIIDIPTIRFLDVTRRSNVIHLRLVDILQLLLRLGVLALFVGAIARPFLSSQSWGSGPVANRVVIFDTSLRMQYTTEEGACLDRAKAKVAELIRSSNPHDRSALVTADRAASVVLPLGARGSDVERALGSVSCTYFGPAALLEAVGAGLEMIPRERELINAVYVFSVFPENAFQPQACSKLAQSLGAARTALGDRLSVHFVSLAPKKSQDLAITGCRLGQEKVLMGLPAKLSPVFENLSGKDQEVRVKLAAGGEVVEQNLSLPKDARYVTDFFYTFNEMRRQVLCQFEVEKDSLPANDRFVTPLKMDALEKILIVDGTPDREGRDDATTGAELIRYALSPDSLLGQENRTGLITEVARPPELRKLILYNYKVIVLYNVTSLAHEDDAKDILSVCREGKGVLIVPGADVDSMQFNRGPLGKALSPAELHGLHKTAPPLQAGSWSLSHPLGRQYRDLRTESLGDVVWTQQFRLSPHAGAKVALSASNDSPLLVTRGLGRGTVALLGSDVLPSWSNLAFTSSFVPFVHRLMSFLAGEGKRGREETIHVGDTFSRRFAPGQTAKGIEVTDPQGRAKIVPAMADGTFSYRDTTTPGVYALKPVGAPDGAKSFFTVNVDPEDVRAPAATNKSIQSRLPGAGLALTSTETFAPASTKGMEVWKLLGLAAVLLYAVEAIVAWLVVKEED